MILEKYRLFHSTDLAEFEGHLRTAVAGSITSARPTQGLDGFYCNAIGLGVMPICYLESDLSTTLDFDPPDYIRLMFQTHGKSRVTVNGKTTEVAARGGNYIVSEGQSARDESPSGFRAMALRIESSELKQKLVSLCGAEVSGQISFEQFPDPNETFNDFVRRPLFAAVRELEASDPLFHQRLMEEIKNLTLTRLLLFAPHNFSNLLEWVEGAPGRSQMNRAEDYVAANWDKNLEVTALAEAVGVSARTILRYFREKHGETPRQYIARIRLERARQMLLSGNSEITVMEVALKCGFSSLGHFAGSYRSRFDELPSQTLKSSR